MLAKNIAGNLKMIGIIPYAKESGVSKYWPSEGLKPKYPIAGKHIPADSAKDNF